MKKRPTETTDGDILPPEEDGQDNEASSSRGSTHAAGAHLRMPPLIDNDGGWADKWGVGQLFGAIGDRLTTATLGARDHLGSFGMRAQSGTLHMLRRMIYQLALWTLIGATLVITGYGIWQARHTALPQFDSFWFNPQRVLQDTLDRQQGTVPLHDLNRKLSSRQLLQNPDTLVPLTPAKNGANRANNRANKETEDEALSNQAAVVPALTQSGDADQAPDPAQIAATTALSAGLEETTALRQDLLAAERKADALLAQLEATQSRLARAQAAAADTVNPQGLAGKYAMADLLLRLDAGLAYEDVIAAGLLEPVMSRREWALLALHGATGIPTRDALRVQFQAFVESLDVGHADTPYRRFMAWLAARADGLLTVTQAPMALQGDALSDISAALDEGQLDDAALLMGRALRRLETAIDTPVHHAVALQAVYDDTRAAAELTPMVERLRRDYIAGVRP